MPGKFRKRLKKIKNRLLGKKPEEEKKILSVDEIAEELGMFPSDIEETVKQLQEQGLVTCYILEGNIYVVPNEGEDLDDLLVTIAPPTKDDPMYQ